MRHQRRYCRNGKDHYDAVYIVGNREKNKNLYGPYYEKEEYIYGE